MTRSSQKSLTEWAKPRKRYVTLRQEMEISWAWWKNKLRNKHTKRMTSFCIPNIFGYSSAIFIAFWMYTYIHWWIWMKWWHNIWTIPKTNIISSFYIIIFIFYILLELPKGKIQLNPEGWHLIAQHHEVLKIIREITTQKNHNFRSIFEEFCIALYAYVCSHFSKEGLINIMP